MTSVQVMGQLPLKLFNKEVDFENDTLKMMLLNESATPNKDIHIYIEDLQGNEISGGSYPSGGVELSNKSITLDLTNYDITFESDDISFTGADDVTRYGVIYSVESSVIIGYIDFEIDIDIAGSDFTVTIPNSILYRIDTYVGPLDGQSDCVYAFSPYKRLTRAYTDELVQVVNLTTSETAYFGYDINGDIESTEILSWLDGADGGVIWHGNQFKTANPTYQSADNSYAPKIAISGVFQTDGLYFDGTDDYMKCDDYTEIQITSRPLSIYGNWKHVTGSSYIVCKNLDTAPARSFAIYHDGTYGNFYLQNDSGNAQFTATLNNTNKFMACWHNSFNKIYVINNNIFYFDNDDFTGTLTNYSQFRIGCRDNTGDTNSHFLNGYIKTVLIFNSAKRDNYYYFVNAGL